MSESKSYQKQRYNVSRGFHFVDPPFGRECAQLTNYVNMFFRSFACTEGFVLQTENHSKIGSLPLDRARWFTRDVVTNPVDAFDFVADPIRNSRQQFVGKPYPVGSHAVLAFDDAKDNRVFVGPLVAHYANRLHRKQNSK